MVGIQQKPRLRIVQAGTANRKQPIRFRGKDPEPPEKLKKSKTAFSLGKIFSKTKQAIVSPRLFLREVLEDRWFFKPSGPVMSPAEMPSTRLRPRIREVFFTTADGVKLHAWYIPAEKTPDGKSRPTVVYAHGQSGNLSLRWRTMETFTSAGFGFLAFDYRGYGKSEGKPSEQGLYTDFDAASAYLAEQQGIGTEDQIAMGGSLGGAVAIDGASRKPFRAVLIYATFTSAIEVLKAQKKKIPVLRHVPTGAFSALLQQRFESEQKIGNIRSPILIVHGAKDALMPVAMSQVLLEKATGAPYRERLVIPEGEHGSLIKADPEAIVAALETMLKKTKP